MWMKLWNIFDAFSCEISHVAGTRKTWSKEDHANSDQRSKQGQVWRMEWRSGALLDLFGSFLFLILFNSVYIGCQLCIFWMLHVLSWYVLINMQVSVNPNFHKQLQETAGEGDEHPKPKNNHNFHQIIALEDSTDKMRQTCCIILSFKTTRCHSWGIQKTQGGAVWFSFPRCDSRVFAARFWSS